MTTAGTPPSPSSPPPPPSPSPSPSPSRTGTASPRVGLVPKDADRATTLQRLDQAFMGFVPQNRALGLVFEDFGDGEATLRLPYREDLVGNLETGVLHGGPLTTLLDATAGASVYLRLSEPTSIATLDLRIDYMKPASPHRDVLARATCYAVTRNVAFVRASAFHDDPDDPIATATATFMLGTKGKSTLARPK
jgi:uncharacterized protein (TIGR00369 family)